MSHVSLCQLLGALGFLLIFRETWGLCETVLRPISQVTLSLRPGHQQKDPKHHPDAGPFHISLCGS